VKNQEINSEVVEDLLVKIIKLEKNFLYDKSLREYEKRDKIKKIIAKEVIKNDN